MKNLKLLVICWLFIRCLSSYSQQPANNGYLYVSIRDSSTLPSNEAISTNNSILNGLFEEYKVFEYKLSWPNAKNPELKNIYEIHLNGDVDKLRRSLMQNSLYANVYFSDYYVPTCSNPLTINDTYINNWANDDHLQMLDAYCAWTITQGNTNIKVAVIDGPIESTHEDLINQLVYNTTIATGSGAHGTWVAGVAGAQVNNNKGVAGVGYNTKITGYEVDGANLWGGIWQAYLDGANVINVSWSGIGSYPILLAVQEIVENSAVLVLGAGNRNFSVYHANYANIPGVINVSGIANDLKHSSTYIHYYTSLIHPDSTHAHNPFVDVCALSINVTSTNSGNDYIGTWGTSFAAPQVAAVAALVLSVNECLAPKNVEHIIKSTTNPILDADDYPGLIGTGYVDAYQAVLMASTYGDVAPITTNTTWNTERYVKGDLVIESGATLTITDKVRFADGAKIIVEQNARLIIDGGYLTSSVGCKNAFWQGIEVWGNSAQHQYTYGSNQLYQGFVELKNGAVIENANTAIWLGKADDWQMLNTGGIVQAYGNSVFRNNKRDVAFLKYQNFNPSNPAQKRGNLSYFRNCKFETTASLNDGSLPTHHVTMWNVDGVRFYGCTFENSNPNATTLAQLGNGIYTEDAHFVVTGCDWNVPCIYMQCCSPAPNIFKHLNYGIRTKQVSGTQYNYNVDNNTFDNCFVNIYNEGVNNAIITRNNHTIGKPRFGSIYGAGVEFNTGSGYRIEENNFTGDPNPNVWFSVGTWITNTGMNNNQVYKNTFSNLNLGNYAYQRNRGYDGTSGLYSGLAFLCNTHTAISWYDIYVYGSDPLNDGIRQYQGKLNLANNDVTASAGNTFSHTGTNADSDISNTNTPNFTYFYDGVPLLTNPKYPYYVTPNRITRVTAPTANTCASNFSLGGFGKNSEQALELNNGNLTGETKQQLVLDYQTYDNILKQYKRLYTSLVDGGNTHGLMQTVENSFPAETWQLRQNLLGKSPYLSKKILEESSEKTTVLPEAIIYEILAANPDGLKDEELLKHLSEKINPLPAWMIELLREGSSQITPRTFLEAAILNSKAQRDQIISYLVHDIISKRGENEEMNHEELRSWLAAYQTPHGDYQIVDDYFETGNYSAGLAILSTIPSIYKLNQTELLEYNGLQSLFNVLAGVKASNRNIFLLNGSEQNAVQDLADNGEGIAKVRACNLLGFVYGTECDYDKVFPQEKQYFKTEKIPAGKDNPLLPSINVFPNPAKDYVEFGYNLPSGALEGTLSITDIKGVVVHRQQLSTKYGQIAIDTREWQQGTYLYALTANGKSVFNQKFVLIK